MTEISPGTPATQARKALAAQRLARRAAKRTIGTRSPDGPVPVSFAQERLWFLDRHTAAGTAYTIPFVRRIRGAVDAEALAAALTAAAARHVPLRTRFTEDDEGRPLATIDEDARFPLETATAAGPDDARQQVDEFLGRGFDLAAGPVAHALLIRLDEDDHVLALAVHHIAADGWSMSILWRDIVASHAGRTPPDPPVRYDDFAAWQRGLEPGSDLPYWRSQLAGVSPLELPTDRPRPPEQTHRGAAFDFTVDPVTTVGLSGVSRDHGATLYMTLLAAFALVLGRASGRDDVTVGSPVAGRALPELDGLIGCFVNVLAMRADLGGDPTFAELLLRVRDTALDAYTHQDLPFERLVAELKVPRDLSRSPIFQALFSMANYADPSADDAAGDTLRVEGFAPGSWATRYDLELYAAADDADGLIASFVYNTDLFDAQTIERIARRFADVLRAVAADPTSALSSLGLPGEEERRLTVEGWNQTATPFPDTTTATVHGLFEAQATRTPEAAAVTFAGQSLTYAELDARAEAVAGMLRGRGIRHGDVVAVCAHRSFELVVALLGVLKSGAAYLPLDPDYPAQRLASMAEDCAARVLLAQRSLESIPDVAGAQIVTLEDLPHRVESAETADPVTPPSAQDIAYVIFTSGSTGKPKGVANTHRGVVNRLRWMQAEFGLDHSDAVLQKTPAGFDVSVWEFFWPLIVGARLVLAEPGGHKDAEYMRTLINSERITTAHFVPTMLGMFLADEQAPPCPTLSRIICSGEELPVDLATRCLRLQPGSSLANLYGPTEAAIDVSAWHCRAQDLAGAARVPIGAPIANTRLYVLDDAMRSAGIAVPGELYIGGAQVALGYLGRPRLTAERFVPDPFGPPGARLYRTGDRARWRPDGTIEFLGRLDHQIKLRGMRIELGEIETALRAQPGITDAVVVVREDQPGDQRLVGYVVGAEPDRAALRRTLPDYMVPTACVVLDALPLSTNGKLDRATLPAPALTLARDAAAPVIAPSTATEVLVAEIWREVLGIAELGVDDDFFDLGGHSLTATRVIAKLRKSGGAGVSVMDLFKHPTVRGIAGLIDTPAADRAPRGLLHQLTPPRSTTPELTLVCVPYGGGSAVVYQPLADALPTTHALWALAIPGHDVGLDEQRLPFDELAGRCVAEIREKVSGPIAVYGHCGVGSALAVEVARRLEAEGRTLEAVYIGAIFPFAKPRRGPLAALAGAARMERLRSDRGYINWLTSMGVSMGDLDPEQAIRIVRTMRQDSEAAEQYFTDLFDSGDARLKARIVTVAGEQDPSTEYYQERYREWHQLTDCSSVVVLREAGHFFLKYRATELARIVTTVHRDEMEAELPRDDEQDRPTWWWHATSRSPVPVSPPGPQPSMRRFLAVAAGQLVSMTGSALTEFAVPLWIYLTSHSLAHFALFSVVALVPGMVVAPLAGAVVDRFDRRRVMLAGDAAAAATQLLFGLLLWTGHLQVWQIYPLLAVLSLALTFQRLAYGSAVAQLVPKRYLGHANGIVQLTQGTASLLVPLVAVGVMAAIGLSGILALDIASYAIAIVSVLLVRFPKTMAWRRHESLAAEIAGGFRYSWGNRDFRRMLGFFAVLNVFLSPLFLLISPLVLSFARLGDVARVSFAGGLGVFLGGLAMTAWGGPSHQRMRAVLIATLALAGFCLLTGLRPNLFVIAVGAFGMSMCLTLLNGVYFALIQVKVPQRFHGRVFALNTLIAWSTLPLGFGVVAPLGSRLAAPLLAPGGALASTVGAVIGTGPGRGIGLLYVTFAIIIAAWTATALRSPLATFDDRVPDAEPDDLIGLALLRTDDQPS